MISGKNIAICKQMEEVKPVKLMKHFDLNFDSQNYEQIEVKTHNYLVCINGYVRHGFIYLMRIQIA